MEKIGKVVAGLLTAAGLTLFTALPAAAFPDRPVRLIVPYTPGGGVDTLTRVLGQKLEREWGQAVIVENRSGGNTIIATDHVAKSPADGYTVLMVTTVFSVNPSLNEKLPYDTLKDFTPVVVAAIAPNFLVAKPSLPANTIKELVDYAQKNPGKLTYGTPGVGTAPHLAAELLKIDGKVEAVNVSYRGSQPMLLALMAGDVDYVFDVIGSLEHVKSGKLKALAVTTSKRNPRFPEIPTMIESGFPGYEEATWFGFVVPAGTPPDVVTKINASMNAALKEPDVQQRLTTLGMELLGGTSDEFGRYIRSEMQKWGDVLRRAGVRPEGAK